MRSHGHGDISLTAADQARRIANGNEYKAAKRERALVTPATLVDAHVIVRAVDDLESSQEMLQVVSKKLE